MTVTSYGNLEFCFQMLEVTDFFCIPFCAERSMLETLIFRKYSCIFVVSKYIVWDLTGCAALGLCSPLVFSRNEKRVHSRAVLRRDEEILGQKKHLVEVVQLLINRTKSPGFFQDWSSWTLTLVCSPLFCSPSVHWRTSSGLWGRGPPDAVVQRPRWCLQLVSSSEETQLFLGYLDIFCSFGVEGALSLKGISAWALGLCCLVATRDCGTDFLFTFVFGKWLQMLCCPSTPLWVQELFQLYSSRTSIIKNITCPI